MHVDVAGNGAIELVCGSMFSGKSEELIRRVHRVQYAKMKVQVFKPLLDDRYSEVEVVSHNGTSLGAQAIAEPAHLLDMVDRQTDCVAIDEIQFFSHDIVEVIQSLADTGKRIICAGLDQDFRGEPFGPMPQLLAVSEYVTKLQAVCVCCGATASRTQRLIDGAPAHVDDPVIMVGAAESYEPRCRQCHEVRRNTIKEVTSQHA